MLLMVTRKEESDSGGANGSSSSCCSCGGDRVVEECRGGGCRYAKAVSSNDRRFNSKLRKFVRWKIMKRSSNRRECYQNKSTPCCNHSLNGSILCCLTNTNQDNKTDSSVEFPQFLLSHRASTESSQETVSNPNTSAISNSDAMTSSLPYLPPPVPPREPVAKSGSSDLVSAPPIPPREPMSKGRDNLFSSISELLQRNVPWYWGTISVGEAQKLLEDRPYGCFLMRDSASLSNLYSITVKRRRGWAEADCQCLKSYTVNIRIEYSNGEFRLMADDFGGVGGSSSVVDLIYKTQMMMKEKGYFCFIKQRRPGVMPKAIALHSHVSRHEVVASLKYLCRMKLRQSIASSHLEQLPALPPTLSEYVKQCPFYDSKLVDAVIQNRTTTLETE